MEQNTEQKTSLLTPPPGSEINLIHDLNKITVSIPSKGFRGKGLVTIVIIGLWLLTILIWSILLLAMKPVYLLYSIPFWAIGIVTLVKAARILELEQSVIVEDNTISLKLKRGSIIDERSFSKDDTTVSLVEGSYYNYAGLSKRGFYPAILYNDNAYSFGERLSPKEKKWFVDFLSYYTNAKNSK